MSEGSYGSCESCGGDIPLARLEVLPWAWYCVPCQQRR
ncbi:TraR/DksA family transcriptional regulator [Micromonospora sp. NPDC005173]